MWRKLLPLLLLSATPAFASKVADVHCQEVATRESLCQVQLEGEVLEGERLFLTNVQESDQIYWKETRLGGTGMMFDQPFSAGLIPRLYSLQPLKGQVDPLLTIKARAIFADSAGIPKEAKVRVVDGRYPLWKFLGPLFYPLLSFFFLLGAWVYLVTRLRQQTIDGWVYPAEELRWFCGSLLAFMLLDHGLTRIFVPIAWSQSLHLFAQRLSLLVCTWSLAGLIASGRFSDRSCVERVFGRPRSTTIAGMVTFFFLAGLCLITFSTNLKTGLFALALSALSAAVFYGGVMAAIGTEWRRILKRSGTTPLLFHFSLLAFSFSLCGVAIGRYVSLFEGHAWLTVASWVVVVTGLLRLQRFQSVQEKSVQLGLECREILQRYANANRRLFALCSFIEEEWGAARVSVISVEGSQGLVLASAGPDAISPENRHEPRKLGPFLRRVCKEGHILYAPVAEELGKDLQEKGWRHSSVAIPLIQEEKVRAVLCIMADEGARINPIDATLMELLTNALGLEILSAVAQHVAEEKNDRLLSIARNAGGLAVEHMDGWGHLHFSQTEDIRFIVGAQAEPEPAQRRFLESHATFAKLLASYQQELRSNWTALAEQFEFLPKEVNGDFWVLSPREFRLPYLQSLGAERAALLLAQAMERVAKQLLAKPAYLPLGICQLKMLVGRSRLKFVSYGTADSGTLDVDATDFAHLLRLREEAPPASFLFLGDEPSGRLADSRFQCRALPYGDSLFSICSVFSDKKEVRKLEGRAHEQAKIYLKRAA